MERGVIPFEDSYVTLLEEDHCYFDTDNREYKSWSAVSKNLYIPFNAAAQSARMAYGNKAKQQALLEEWDKTRDDACEYGSDIHSRMEDFVRYGLLDAELCDVQERLQRHTMQGYEQICPERTVWMHWPIPGGKKDEVEYYAGQADKLLVRPRRHVVDIDDYKTNRAHGIRRDSSYISKKGLYVPGSKFLLHPVEHLEECEYNKYALQMSAYALMLEMTYGVRIGKLTLYYIYHNENGIWDYEAISMPYMKYEVIAIYNADCTKKQVPF